ncbi:hypothetical protein GQ457_11G030830 [Hibiscus cannabinus]
MVISTSNYCFRFTELHGFSETIQKVQTWQLIDYIQPYSNLPWIIGGDFNEVLSDNEKQGGILRARSQINNFHDCLARNNLYDCKPKDGWFTWTKSGPNTPAIFERLDRFVATSDWFHLFPNQHAISSFHPKSNHSIITMSTNYTKSLPSSPHITISSVLKTVGLAVKFVSILYKTPGNKPMVLSMKSSKLLEPISKVGNLTNAL